MTEFISVEEDGLKKPNHFSKFWSKFSGLPNSTKYTSLAVLAVIAIIPITVATVQQQEILSQHAAGVSPTPILNSITPQDANTTSANNETFLEDNQTLPGSDTQIQNSIDTQDNVIVDAKSNTTIKQLKQWLFNEINDCRKGVIDSYDSTCLKYKANNNIGNEQPFNKTANGTDVNLYPHI